MKAKIGAIFLVSVMAFAAIGAAYAHWEESLTIEGLMTTDDIHPVFDCYWTNDGGNCMDPAGEGEWAFGATPTWGITGAPDRREKNVGQCEWSTDEDYPYELNLGISDAYPCYYAHPAFCIRNIGSCPVLVHAVILSKLSFKVTIDDEPVDIEFTNLNIELVKCNTYYVDFYLNNAGDWKYKVVLGPVNNPEKYDYSIHVTGDDMEINTQLDPWAWGHDASGGMIDPSNHIPMNEYVDTIYGDLAIHFENGCREKATYDFALKIVFYNWPEIVAD